MSKTSQATRRSFIRTAGTALSGPIAAAAVTLPRPAAGAASASAAVRLARLEDGEAIRALNQAHALQVHARALDFGQHDVIEIASDRQTATATIHCLVEAEVTIGPECPAVEMARAQGGGVIRHAQRGVFENTFIRRDGRWMLEQSLFRPT